jgi:hypothetical protein
METSTRGTASAKPSDVVEAAVLQSNYNEEQERPTGRCVRMIFLIAFLIRVLGIFASPLWYDEILSLHRAQLPFWDHMVVHVNVWEIILRTFANPYMIRVPSLICASAALWLAWLIMQELRFDAFQQMGGMIALTFMPGLLWMAQDARYYSGIALIYMASVLFALKGQWLGLVAVSGLSPFVHPTAPAYIIPAWILITLHEPRRAMLSAMALPVIWLLSPTMPAFFSDHSTFWIKNASVEFIIQQYSLAIGMNPLNIIPAIVFMIFVMACAVMKFNGRAWLILFAPLAVIIAVSELVQPVAFYRTLQPSLMGLGILIGSFTPGIKRLPFMAAPLILLAWMMAQYNPTLHGGHIERGTDKVIAEWRDGDCIRYGDEFSRVAVSELLTGYPACAQGQPREWLITTTLQEDQRDDFPFFNTDAWHFAPIYFYGPATR